MANRQGPEGFPNERGGGPNYSGKYGYPGTSFSNYGPSHRNDYDAGPRKSLLDYFIIIRQRFWHLLFVFLVVFGGVAFYTLTQTKQFTSGARVRILRSDVSPMMNPGQMIDENDRIANSEDISTQIRIMESISIIDAVDERIRGEERRLFLEPFEGKKAELQGPLFTQNILFENREIRPVRGSLIVDITFTHPNPVIASEVANYFAEEYRKYNINLNLDEARKSVSDLKRKAKEQRKKVRELELQAAEYKERHATVSVDENENIAAQQLQQLNQILIQDRNHFSALQTQVDLIKRYEQEGNSLWDLSFIASNPLVAEMQAVRSSQNITIASLKERYREKHPKMIEAIRQLSEIDAELGSAVNSAKAKIFADFEQAKTNYELSRKNLELQQSDLIEISKIKTDYNSILLDLEVEKNFYQILTSELSKREAETSWQNSNVQIIDRAIPPEDPSSPRVLLNLAAGFIGGIVLGFGFIFLLAFFDDRIKTMSDVEDTLGLQILGVIPRFLGKKDFRERAVAVLSQKHNHIVESFRSLYSSLQINEESRESKVLLVTSTVPGEGKSTIASNLCQSFSSHGCKTLLIDCDLRLPNVARLLDIKNEKGFLEYFSEGAALDDLILKDFAHDMDVLPVFGESKNPIQILNSQEFESLLTELSKNYDKIVLDSPPVGAVSDALNLLNLVDGVVYVISYNTVKMRAAQGSIRRIAETQTPIFGSVMNNVPNRVTSYYYSHYYYKAYGRAY